MFFSSGLVQQVLFLTIVFMIRSSSSYAGENCLRLYNSWVVASGVRVICRVLLMTYLYRMESKSLLGYPLLMKVCFILFMVVSNIDQLEKNL